MNWTAVVAIWLVGSTQFAGQIETKIPSLEVCQARAQQIAENVPANTMVVGLVCVPDTPVDPTIKAPTGIR